MAAEEHHIAEEAAHAAEAFLGVDAKGWVGIAFIVFAILFVKYVWPLLANILDSRSAQIEAKLREASELKEEAQAILAEAERKSAEADQATKDMISTAKADAKQMIVNAEAEIEKEIEEKISLANKKIERAQKLAIENVKNKAVDAAIDAASELIEKKISKGSKKDALIKDSLKVISGSVK